MITSVFHNNVKMQFHWCFPISYLEGFKALSHSYIIYNSTSTILHMFLSFVVIWHNSSKRSTYEWNPHNFERPVQKDGREIRRWVYIILNFKLRAVQWIHHKTFSLSLSASLWVCRWLSDSDNWLSQLLLFWLTSAFRCVFVQELSILNCTNRLCSTPSNQLTMNYFDQPNQDC